MACHLARAAAPTPVSASAPRPWRAEAASREPPRSASFRSREWPGLDQLRGHGGIGRGLAAGRAQLGGPARAAGRPPRVADPAAMPDQPVREHRPLGLGKEGADLLLDLVRVILRRPPESAGEAAEMGVHRDARDAKGI